MIHVHELAGRPACGGKAAGRPVIVHSVSDLGTVEPGDILVAIETEAIYAPAMHRAGAIVTERGGRFCHAAIWARENGKPTVLAVENATEALSGAGRVEVDADTGLIRWKTQA